MTNFHSFLNLKKLTFLFVIYMLAINFSIGQNKHVEKVKQILQGQADDWNITNLDGFMQPYWKSDKLQFIGSKGVTYGWQQTLDNYKKSYPDKQAMGFLTFDLLDVTQHSRKVISMTGKWHLERKGIENLEGHFLLIWKKIKGQWLIIADHSS